MFRLQCLAARIGCRMFGHVFEVLVDDDDRAVTEPMCRLCFYQLRP